MKTAAPLVNGFRNKLLNGLPQGVLRKLEKKLERMQVHCRQLIYEANAAINDVYFPETAVGSMVTMLDDGREIEVATVGYEGILGLPAFLGAETTPGRAFWQIAGVAYRLHASDLLNETVRGGRLNTKLHLYIQALFTQIAQGSTCNRIHNVQQRCCRWLLMTHDRVEGDEFDLTHEFLAQMLGIRRSGVTIAVGQLQKARLLRYVRGRMKILDRQGLEQAACECNGVVRREFERLLG